MTDADTQCTVHKQGSDNRWPRLRYVTAILLVGKLTWHESARRPAKLLAPAGTWTIPEFSEMPKEFFDHLQQYSGLSASENHLSCMTQSKAVVV